MDTHLKELVNKQVEINKYKQITYYIFLCTTILLNLFVTINMESKISPTPILIIVIIIVSLIVIPSFVMFIVLLNKLKKNSILINKIIKNDSRNNYIQDSTDWKDNVYKKLNAKNKKISIIFFSIGTLAIIIFITFLILSIVNNSWIKDEIDINPIDIVSIVFVSIFGILSLIFILFGFVFLSKLKEFEIQGYVIINERNENLYYKDTKLNTLSLSSYNEIELPNKEKVVYIGGALFPLNLIEKEENNQND